MKKRKFENVIQEGNEKFRLEKKSKLCLIISIIRKLAFLNPIHFALLDLASIV